MNNLLKSSHRLLPHLKSLDICVSALASLIHHFAQPQRARGGQNSQNMLAVQYCENTHSGNIKGEKKRDMKSHAMSLNSLLSRTMNIKLLVESATAAAPRRRAKRSLLLWIITKVALLKEKNEAKPHTYIMIHAQWVTERIIRSVLLSPRTFPQKSLSHCDDAAPNAIYGFDWCTTLYYYISVVQQWCNAPAAIITAVEAAQKKVCAGKSE